MSDVLGSLLDNIYSKGLFEGFTVGRDLVHISNLQFADYTLLFSKDEDTILSISLLSETIKDFEWLLGLKVNWEKSSLVVSISIF